MSVTRTRAYQYELAKSMRTRAASMVVLPEANNVTINSNSSGDSRVLPDPIMDWYESNSAAAVSAPVIGARAARSGARSKSNKPPSSERSPTNPPTRLNTVLRMPQGPPQRLRPTTDRQQRPRTRQGPPDPGPPSGSATTTLPQQDPNQCIVCSTKLPRQSMRRTTTADQQPHCRWG